MIGHQEQPARVALVLIPKFSMLALTGAIEVMRMANQLAGCEHYRWQLVSLDGDAVAASNGLSLAVDVSLAESAASSADIDAVLVAAGLDVHQTDSEALMQALRQLAAKGATLGGICTGSWLLARAGVLDGYRCTIHWENVAAFREAFPELVVSAELFEIDRDRLSCAGGIAPIDMMLYDVRVRCGASIASRIAEQFMLERIRDRHEKQKVPLTQRVGAAQPKLAEALALMEANIEEPIGLDELSRHVGLSRRQLERLFQRYLQCVPTRYYLELRLERARQLLLQTGMPILDVAQACGFVSAPHFSKCYRENFSLTPRDERRRASELLR
ncbi:MAG: AraC family transcriptional regulator [Gammaproteobacteria bacterium]|nr:MAG: AraC family transcriptional regulator [Gammaproteobacteria bacterium]